MASISSLTGSSSGVSSIYGNSNIISGLASGLDTEALIENSVAGYKTRIQQLLQQQTKLSWKQDSYRSITDKLIDLSQKYTSYTSKTNLSSPSFFNNAVSTLTSGENKDRVSASGRSGSDIQINAVKQLASAARYAVDASHLKKDMDTASTKAFDLGTVNVSNISGSLTLKLGNKTVELEFEDGEVYESAAELANAITNKLQSTEIVGGKASEFFAVEESNGHISFKPADADETSLAYISDASGNFSDFLKQQGVEPWDGYVDKNNSAKWVSSFSVPEASDSVNPLYSKVDAATYLKDKTINVAFDGQTKKVSLSGFENAEGATAHEKLVNTINKQLSDEFGSKVRAELNETGDGINFITTSESSSLRVTSDASEFLGMGKNGISNYLDTSKSMKDILGKSLAEFGASTIEAKGTVSYNSKKGYSVDEDGNRVEKVGEGDDAKWLRVDEDGRNLLYSMKINGKQVGAFSDDDDLASVMSAINSSDAGVKVNYSTVTNKFTFTATKTGSEGRIDFEDALSKKLFTGKTKDKYALGTLEGASGNFLVDSSGNPIVAGQGINESGETVDQYIMQYGPSFILTDKNGIPLREDPSDPLNHMPKRVSATDKEYEQYFKSARDGFTAGTDAVFSVTVNGEEKTLTRSSNTASLDGMNVTLKETFNEDAFGADNKIDLSKVKKGSEVTFSTKADADKIFEAVNTFVEEFNKAITEVHDQFSTRAATRTGKVKSYEPLTEEEKEEMSESEIKAYEEKAKQGLLFGDTDLQRLYNAMRDAISPIGDDRKAMESIGLTLDYSDGVTTLSLDETKLREALERDPDSVQKAFTSSRENGDKSDGIMARIKKVTEQYASTSIGNYGILVKKAGTTKKSLTLMDNTIYSQMGNIDEQIDRWQNKMSDKIDYYTRQYSMLEQLMNQMNSQSSTLSGLMGG